MVTWTATIAGGSGKLARLEWGGQQTIAPQHNTDDWKVWPDGLAADSNDSYTPALNVWNWALNTPLQISHKIGTLQTRTTETITHTKTSGGINRIEVKVTRPYIQPNGQSQITADANISVRDQDTSLQSFDNVQCNGTVNIIQR